MAETQKETTQVPTKDERLASLELDNLVLKETLNVCLVILLDAALYGTVKRAHDGMIRGAIERLSV